MEKAMTCSARALQFLQREKLSKKIYFYLLFIFATSSFFTGCMTSQRQDQLQGSISQLQGQVSSLQQQLKNRDQQITNTTQAAISSQTEVQNLQTQIQLTQGSVDELKARIKRIEENSNDDRSEQDESTGPLKSDIVELQKKASKLDILTSLIIQSSKKIKLPEKLKTVEAISKTLKTDFEQAKYKQLVDNAYIIINAEDASDNMIMTALEYRAETRFKMKDYKRTIVDFDNYLERYPKAQKRARAMLFVGDSYVYLKKNAMAKIYYNECSKLFPNSPEGKACANRLSNLISQSKIQSKAL